MKNILHKKYCLFFLFFITQLSFSQLANFSFVVTKADESCTGNGALFFNVQQQTSGSTIIYSIYNFPNVTTPISVLSTNTFTGLSAGNYRVVATQTLGNLSNSQQQDIQILDIRDNLTYQLSSEQISCAAGSIIVTVLTGSPLTYEIISGPIIVLPQTSNVFTNLTSGVYTIRVNDACGDGVVQTYFVENLVSEIIITSNNTFTPGNCDSVQVLQELSYLPGSIIVYPLSIQYTVYPPVGSPIVFNQTLLNSEDYDFPTISQLIPLFPNQYYTYDFQVIDACGNQFTNNGNVVNSSVIPHVFIYEYNCNSTSYSFFAALSVLMTSAPSSYPNSLPFQLPNNSFSDLVLVANDLLPGNYSFDVVDVCGVHHFFNFTVDIPIVPVPVFSVQQGCQLGFGYVSCSSFREFQSVFIIAAPSNYMQQLPHDVSLAIVDADKRFFISEELPNGNYIFRTTDVCGTEHDLSVVIDGYQETNDINIIENCNSFDISLYHESNNNNILNAFWLQKYNTVTNQWEHPITGVVFPLNSYPNDSNSISLMNNYINYNFTSTGHFRIIKIFAVTLAGTFEYSLCLNVLEEFDYNNDLVINKVYSFQCSENSYDVLVDANGIGNLIYRITLKNGNSFVINNGNNPIFLNLEPATYNFQVEDSCGNIFNIIFDVPSPFNLEITPTNLCNGQTGYLTVPNFSFLDYQWWKGTATTNILSTSNFLAFPNLNLANAAGIYHVRIRYLSNPNSCIDYTIDYTISTNSSTPNAGQDGIVTLCGGTNNVNLNSILTGTFDSNGTWSEVTASGGFLNNNLWSPIGVAVGTYTFKYTVTGFCSSFDEAQVTINYNQAPSAPTINAISSVCSGDALQLSVATISNATYLWTGPDNYQSTVQNPIINNVSAVNGGVYTVKASIAGCESSASITITVNPIPNFTISAACVSEKFTVLVSPVENSFTSETVSYNWQGPSGYSSSQNPIQLNGQPSGIYTVTVTNENGCETSQSVTVLNTLCTIPKGISPNDDGSNDTFDLSGFDVTNLKIFNRYGMVVYELSEYEDQWMGQDYNGNLLPSGTYYYYVRLNSGEAKTGWVYLSRKF